MADEQKQPEEETGMSNDEMGAVDETIDAEISGDAAESAAESVETLDEATTDIDPIRSTGAHQEVASVEEALEEELNEIESVTPDYNLEAEEEAAEELAESADNELEEAVAAAVESSVDASESESVQAVNEAVESTMSSMEHVADEGVTMTTDVHHGDTFVIPLLNQQMTLPGGIYTFIFGVLAALTAFEVAVTLLLPEGNVIAIALLVTASLFKAFLVVAFYMHLNTDNPIFRVVLIVPLLIVLVSVLYLLGVPVGEGLGYR